MQTNAIDLSPSKWIWLPSERCLPNTFVLFRKEISLATKPPVAPGWVTADSRYKLSVNGERVQWGPAPCDPRWLEADPIDLAPYLKEGTNVIAIEVCYFGHGEGTWAMGAPGLIFQLNLEGQQVVSDASWQCRLDRAHRPGMYKRWFLRSLQEEFDVRLHPYGWDTVDYSPDAAWVAARELPGKADGPATFAGGPEYNIICNLPPPCTDEAENPGLVKRAIPMMREEIIPIKRLEDCGRMKWLRDPDDWFESRMPGCFEAIPDASVEGSAPAANEGFYFTYELEEHAVGFPRFEIEAEEGTIVDLIVGESHDTLNGPKWLDTFFFCWSRFICRKGKNVFETFDYESLKWLQLHVRGTAAPVKIREVGIRRRVYDWPHKAHIRTSDRALQQLVDATVNTLFNSAQETAMDGAGRERQQYSGDGGHQQYAIRYAFGDVRHGARYLDTFSQGITQEGYFLDCWPAFDRLARLMQRELKASYWGPLLDHGIGFNFDCWNHYMESGDKEALRRPYPRLKRFATYLRSIIHGDGLLPVEDIGVPTVWLDHVAYQKQSHRRCAFNLYAAAMLQHALAPIAELFGEDGATYRQTGRELEAATVANYWDTKKKIFVVGDGRLCDRSLATAILFDQCPGGDTSAAVKALVDCPPEMGISYPCNAVWRYWALGKAGRQDVILNDLRQRWATMPSVVTNNSVQEDWVAEMDSTQEFSHCAMAPLIMLFQSVAGINPTRPGFAACEIRPRLADLEDFEITARTPQGDITLTASAREVRITVPASCEATLVLPDGSRQNFADEITFAREEMRLSEAQGTPILGQVKI